MADVEIRVVGQVRQVGNSLAFFIPADDARKADLEEGETVDVRIHKDVSSPRGLLHETGLPYERFDRDEEGLWRDRI